MHTLVVIPTYNERESLAGVLTRLRRSVPTVHVLVVDDGSPDGTADVARAMAELDGQIHLLERSSKKGIGAAYQAGFHWGLSRGAEILVEMDADGSHRPEQLPRLLQAFDSLDPTPDLVIGSRWVAGGAVHRWPMSRQLLSWTANLYTRCALRTRVADSTAGFRAYRAGLLSSLVSSPVASQGYCFQIDMTRQALALGARIVEVPIDFDEREHGQSKMSCAIIGEAMWRVTAWGVHRWSHTLRARLTPPRYDTEVRKLR